MTHTLPAGMTATDARALHPRAAIIRRTADAVLVFDRTEDAWMHETAQVVEAVQL